MTDPIPQDELERLRALDAEATEASAITLNRYEHGGGRAVAVLGNDERKLVCDTYNKGDREFYFAARTALPRLLGVAEAYTQMVAEVERLRAACREWAEECQKISLECDKWHRVAEAAMEEKNGE